MNRIPKVQIYYHTWLGKGIISDLMGNFQTAISELNVALDLEPDSYNYLRALASAYENDGQLEKALETYEKAHDSKESDTDIALEWMSCLSFVSCDLVAEKFESTVSLQKNDGAKLAMVYVSWMLGNQSDAIFYFEDVSQSDASLAKSLFLHFPELKSNEYFINRLEELDETDDNEKL